VMRIAQILAGYTLGGADLLRKAMGKKKPEEMAKQRSIFVGGAVARGVPEQQAVHIFDLMEKFAGYGFNKSHSAAYAVLSYQTAYLKTHHTAAFMAAVLSADMDHTDKVVTLIDECKQLQLAVLPPDVNTSLHEFAVADANTIRYGLGAVKGVGQGAVEALIAERAARGAYRSLAELCRRTDLTRINRRTLEALIRSGSMDSIGPNRATLLENLPAAMQLGDQTARAHQAGQNDMFGLSAMPERGAEQRGELKAVADFSEAVRLQGERETLGLYLTGHPIDRFEADLPRFAAQRIGELISEKPPTAGEGERGRSGSMSPMIRRRSAGLRPRRVAARRRSRVRRACRGAGPPGRPRGRPRRRSAAPCRPGNGDRWTRGEYRNGRAPRRRTRPESRAWPGGRQRSPPCARGRSGP